jgi:effector-binding domain-containing protein
MENLVPIGRFSQMTRLSIKALRRYDELGLLAPAWIDPGSGYRYYTAGQANLAEAIRVLRRVDMPLAEIEALLAEADPEIRSKHLAAHRERLAEQLAEQTRMIRFLEALMRREGAVMPYEVTIKELPPVRVAAMKKHVRMSTVGSALQAGFGEIVQALGRSGVEPNAAPFVIYHEVIDEDTEGDIEMCIPVAGAVEPTDNVYVAELAGGPAAVTVHHGPYQELAPAYHTLTGWIQEHGHEVRAAPREVYLNDPTTTLPEDLLTEIQWPVR